MKYSEEYIEEVAEIIKQKTILAMKVNESSSSGVGPQKIILFFLDKYLKRNMYRTIYIKLMGLNIQNPKETDVTHKLETLYEDLKEIKDFLKFQTEDYDSYKTKC